MNRNAQWRVYLFSAMQLLLDIFLSKFDFKKWNQKETAASFAFTWKYLLECRNLKVLSSIKGYFGHIWCDMDTTNDTIPCSFWDHTLQYGKSITGIPLKNTGWHVPSPKVIPVWKARIKNWLIKWVRHLSRQKNKHFSFDRYRGKKLQWDV